MSEQIIRVPGKFVPFEAGTPLMDEKDIKKTSQVDSEDVKTEGGVLKFADKAYVPNDFSGMGRVYLRKNMISASLHFADIISDLPSTETETLFDCDEIVYETTNNRFLAVKHTSEGKKYYPNYQFTDSEVYSEPDDKHIYVCDANAKLYTYENGALEETTTLMDKNVLTQDMINKPNTIYIIQYDYDIVDMVNDTTTNNLTVDDEYYSYKPITIEDNQTYRALNDCVFIDYHHNSLIGSVLVTGENESQNYAIAKKSSAASGVPVSYYKPDGTINVPANCVLQFEGGSIKNGTITGNGTRITSESTKKIFTNIEFYGSFLNDWNICWFGGVGDCHIVNGRIQSATDNTEAIQSAFDAIRNLDGELASDGWSKSFQGLYFPPGKYAVYGQLHPWQKTAMFGRDSNSTSIVCDYNGTVFYFNPDLSITGSTKYWTLDVHDLSFEVPEYSDKTVCAFANRRTADATMRTWMSRWRFSRCKFMYFNIALNIEVSYYGRISDCDFTRCRVGDIRLTNANSTSIVNCNFCAGEATKEYCICYDASADGKAGVCGTSVMGCNFDEGGVPILVYDDVCGMNIVGNYFEPYIQYIDNGSIVLETMCRPYIHFAKGDYISSLNDVVITGNGVFQTYSNWTSHPLEPKFYILIDSVRLINSHIDGDICINPEIGGSGNFGQINGHPYATMKAYYQQMRELEVLLYNTPKTSPEYATALEQLSTLTEQAKAAMQIDDSATNEKINEVFSLNIRRKTGIPYISVGEFSGNPLFLALGATYNGATGTYSLHGTDNLSDIDMGQIARCTIGMRISSDMSYMFERCRMKAIPYFANMDENDLIRFTTSAYMFKDCKHLIDANFGQELKPSNTMEGMFYGCISLKSVSSIRLDDNIVLTDIFKGCAALESVAINTLAGDISFADCPKLNKTSLVNMITNSAGGRTFSITLHSTTYNALANDSDVLAALNNRPLITLVEAQ